MAGSENGVYNQQSLVNPLLLRMSGPWGFFSSGVTIKTRNLDLPVSKFGSVWVNCRE